MKQSRKFKKERVTEYKQAKKYRKRSSKLLLTWFIIIDRSSTRAIFLVLGAQMLDKILHLLEHGRLEILVASKLLAAVNLNDWGTVGRVTLSAIRIVKPVFMLAVESLQILECNATLFFARPLQHSFHAQFRISLEIDYPVQFDIANCLEDMVVAIMVDGQFKLTHKAAVVAVLGKDKPVSEKRSLKERYWILSIELFSWDVLHHAHTAQ